MNKEEIKEGMEKVAGGFDSNLQKKAKPVKCGKSILDKLPSNPALYYGGPAIRPIKPDLIPDIIDKPVITKKPEQPEQPVEPLTPAKPEDSEILK